MYQTTQPFDPEGVLGTINSIVMGYLGMQVGQIIYFSSMSQQVIILLSCQVFLDELILFGCHGLASHHCLRRDLLLGRLPASNLDMVPGKA